MAKPTVTASKMEPSGVRKDHPMKGRAPPGTLIDAMSNGHLFIQASPTSVPCCWGGGRFVPHPHRNLMWEAKVRSAVLAEKQAGEF